MAYNSGFNPDALPAHAEPEQAAQMISSQQQQQQRRPSNPPQDIPQQQQRPYSNSTPQPYNAAHQQPQQQPPLRPSYNQKPVPPLPNQASSALPPQRRLSPNSNAHYTSNAGPPPPPSKIQSPPPPPQPYANSPPPPQQQLQTSPRPRPHSFSRPQPPPSPQPPSANTADASLFPLFKAVDTTGTGALSEHELGKALVNSDFSHFDPHTVHIMHKMFSTPPSPDSNPNNHNGSAAAQPTLTFENFTSLWTFLAAWRALFERFDTDASGYISLNEYSDALVAFGYRLSGGFVGLLYGTFERGRGGRMSFDLFVQSCIVLKRMTDVFKGYDEDRDGYVTLSFEEFLTEILRHRT